MSKRSNRQNNGTQPVQVSNSGKERVSVACQYRVLNCLAAHFPCRLERCENQFMRAQLQRGQTRGGRGGAVTSSICILLVAQSCTAQNSPAPGTIRGTVADSSGSMVEAAIVRLQAPGSTAPRTTLTDQT